MTDDVALPLLEQNIRTAQMLGHAVALRDHDTSAHNVRVALYAGSLGEALGFDEPMIQGLMKGSFLHDVGKIGISDSILLKPGPLTEEELVVMRRHPALGVELLEDLPWFADALPVVRHHHERFDGDGYPDGLQGEATSPLARAFAIVDVFDALVSIRPYKPASSMVEALSFLMTGSGTQFDPSFVGTFVRIVPPLYKAIAHQPTHAVQRYLDSLRHRHFGA